MIVLRYQNPYSYEDTLFDRTASRAMSEELAGEGGSHKESYTSTIGSQLCPSSSLVG